MVAGFAEIAESGESLVAGGGLVCPERTRREPTTSGHGARSAQNKQMTARCTYSGKKMVAGVYNQSHLLGLSFRINLVRLAA